MLLPPIATLLLAAPQGNLVADLNPGASAPIVDVSPQEITALPSGIYFSGHEPTFGRELYFSDGTVGGTGYVTDLFWGDKHSIPSDFLELPSGEVLFLANTANHGRELMRTDGTAAGTGLVADLLPGTASADLSGLTLHQGEAWFVASDGSGGRGLWRSDGTAAGTVLVDPLTGGGAPISEGSEFVVSTPTGVIVSTTSGADAAFEWRLWSATTSGATLLASGSPGEETPPGPAFELGGRVYFGADDGSKGQELWSTDGTSQGTALLADVNTGPWPSDPSEFTEYGGALYFTAKPGAGSRQVFGTDGTTAGTLAVTSISPGNVKELTALGGLLLFQATTNANGAELWASLGLPGSEWLFADFAPGGGDGEPEQLVELGGVIYCTAWSFASGWELFRADGTPQGTGIAVELMPASQHTIISGLSVANGKLVFSGMPSDGSSNSREELWISDGTPAGTIPLTDSDAVLYGWSSKPQDLTSLGDVVVFTAATPDLGRELWRTDGTTAGTYLLGDFAPGFDSSFASYNDTPLVWKDRVWFAPLVDGISSLWSTDGTVAGTVQFPGSALVTGSWRFLGVYEDQLYVIGDVDDTGRKLWAIAEPSATPTVVSEKGLGVHFKFGDPQRLRVLDGRAYFLGYDAAGREGLWVTDGTEAGTQEVYDLESGGLDGYSHLNLEIAGDRLVFVVNRGASSDEVWSSDGTTQGTSILSAIATTLLPYIGSLQVFEDRVVFTATGDDTGRQLYATDGHTVERITDFNLPPAGKGIASSFYVGPGWILGAVGFDDAGPIPAASRHDLWISDLASGGTTLLTTIDPTGHYPSFAGGPVLGDRVLFTANDGEFGREHWVTDGTAAGTMRVTDINPGGADAASSGVVRLGDQVLTGASTEAVGGELFAFDLADTGAWVADEFGAGCAGSSGVAPGIAASGAASPGDTLQIALDAAAPATPAVLYFAVGFQPSTLDGCQLYLQGPLPLTTGLTDGVGELVQPIAIPADPALAGAQAWWQWAVADPGGALFGIGALSAALEVIVGG